MLPAVYLLSTTSYDSKVRLFHILMLSQATDFPSNVHYAYQAKLSNANITQILLYESQDAENDK